jgi:hypothetical protein
VLVRVLAPRLFDRSFCVDEVTPMPRLFYESSASVLICLMLAGCGGGGAGVKTYPVKGTVSFNGQPLAEAAVNFYPAQGRPAAGITDAQGAFFLSTFTSKDGAAAGTYTVAIAELAKEIEMPKPGDPIAEPTPPRFPIRYTDPFRSGLTAEVKPGSGNEFKFELHE